MVIRLKRILTQSKIWAKTCSPPLNRILYVLTTEDGRNTSDFKQQHVDENVGPTNYPKTPYVTGYAENKLFLEISDAKNNVIFKTVKLIELLKYVCTSCETSISELHLVSREYKSILDEITRNQHEIIETDDAQHNLQQDSIDTDFAETRSKADHDHLKQQKIENEIASNCKKTKKLGSLDSKDAKIVQNSDQKLKNVKLDNLSKSSSFKLKTKMNKALISQQRKDRVTEEKLKINQILPPQLQTKLNECDLMLEKSLKCVLNTDTSTSGSAKFLRAIEQMNWAESAVKLETGKGCLPEQKPTVNIPNDNFARKFRNSNRYHICCMEHSKQKLDIIYNIQDFYYTCEIQKNVCEELLPVFMAYDMNEKAIRKNNNFKLEEKVTRKPDPLFQLQILFQALQATVWTSVFEREEVSNCHLLQQL
ncbi:hypothetical protein GQR58_026261 [Nymphon striatum]|nr:hypothetical protein GQR58_026261 [Nymphon striatum]